MSDLNAKFRKLTDEVPIPYPWDTIEYVNRVAEYRGRPIVLWPIRVGALAGTGCGTGSGLWVAQDDNDVIMYGAETDWHADHIIAHELGHMLLGHRDETPGSGADDLPLQTLMPALSPESIRSVLRRRDYDTERERAAETFADLLLVQAALPKRSSFRSTFFGGRRR